MPMLPVEVSKQKIVIFFFILLSLVLVVTNVYFYRQATSASREQAASQKATEDLVAKVGKLIMLPDETPSIATVTDPEKLKKDQPFFANAKVGDKVLIYATARKAIMYSPTENKIVEVAPLLIGNPAPIGTAVTPQ